MGGEASKAAVPQLLQVFTCEADRLGPLVQTARYLVKGALKPREGQFAVAIDAERRKERNSLTPPRIRRLCIPLVRCQWRFALEHGRHANL